METKKEIIQSIVYEYKKLILEGKLTYKAASITLNISPTYLHFILSGERNPPKEIVIKMLSQI